jgi:prolyl oligopeptidase
LLGAPGRHCLGTSARPILLRIEGKAGHGAGKPISKRIDEAAYVYAFLFWQLGVQEPGEMP